MDLDAGDWVLDTNDLGKVRLQVESRDDKPVFVGIARTSDVENYLQGVSHTTLTDVDTSPFEATYDNHAGNRRPVAPADSQIWVASEHGSGKQTLNWEIEDGDYSVVVMNADGSAGVDADVSTGANIPFLDEIGWTAVGSGGFVLLIGIALLVAGIRRPSNPTGTAPVTSCSPGSRLALGRTQDEPRPPRTRAGAVARSGGLGLEGGLAQAAVDDEGADRVLRRP